MSERSRERKNRVVAMMASLALVVGLVPVPALAAAGSGEPPVDSSPAAVSAAEPAATSVEEPSKAAAPVEDESKAAAPAEESSKAAAPVEEKSKAAALVEGESEAKAPAEESSKAATPAEETGKAPAAEYPAFKQNATIGGVTVTVEAGAGAFPEGARLSVTAVSSSATEAAVAPERGAGESVAASYTFDIKVLEKDGEEVQPANGKSVKVSFAAVEVADPNLDVSVYHVSGGEAEELSVSESGSTATAQSTGFSYYTVEFTYGELQYVLQGGESVPLADVLATVGLQGVPTDATSSAPELFGVARDENGVWKVSAKQAFTSAETLTVTINGQNYEIAVKDEQSGTCGDGVAWTLDDEGVLTISGTGAMTNFSATNIPWLGIQSSVKCVVIKQGVTSIGNNAFGCCENITSVTIPSGVESIGTNAFNGCTKLESVKIPFSVTSIGESAFSHCPLVSVEIPSDVAFIGAGAFNGCKFLTSVAIPNGVTSIERNTFRNCTKLESVEIPSSVTSIGDGAFMDCSSLKSVEIPSDVTSIGRNTFRNCTKLESVEIPGSVTSIGENAFCSCSELNDIFVDNLEENVTPVEPWHESATTVHWRHGVTMEASPEAGGTVEVTPASSSGTYWDKDPVTLDPTVITVEAKPKPGYFLSKLIYKEEGSTEETDITSEKSFDMPNADVTVTASFKPKTKVTITAIDQTYIYNGQTQGEGDTVYEDAAEIAEKVKVEGLQGNDTLTAITLDGQGKDVGEYELVPSNAAIGGSADNYAITYVNGTLTIEPAPVQEYTVTFANWDGTVLQSGKVAAGQLPKYEGDEPTKPSDDKYTYTFSGWTPEVVAVTGDATYTATYAETPKDKPVYKVVSGAGGSWTAGSGEPMVFKIERSVDPETAFSHFVGINVDGKALPEKDASGKANWTARSGSVIVELQPAYLGTLSEGKHTLTALFDDGDPVTAEFKVAAKPSPSPDKGSSPKTGDPLAGAFVITTATAIIALIAMVAFAVRRRRA